MPTKEQPIYVLVPSTISSAERHFLFSEQRLAKLSSISTNVCAHARTTSQQLVYSPKLDFLQADPDEITVDIKTRPADAEDNSYMCDVEGMLQWHAQIKYTATDATARGSTPAVMAAQANDYVAYSAADFKTALATSINDEVSH